MADFDTSVSSRERSLQRNAEKLDRLSEERIAEFGRALSEDNVVLNYEKVDGDDVGQHKAKHLEHCHDELKDILGQAERARRAAEGQ